MYLNFHDYDDSGRRVDEDEDEGEKRMRNDVFLPHLMTLSSSCSRRRSPRYILPKYPYGVWGAVPVAANLPRGFTAEHALVF